MYTQEYTPTLPDIIGDADIHQILDEQLIRWNAPGNNTEKYLVEGMPT